MKKTKHLGWLAELARPHTYASMLISSVTLVLLAPVIDNTPTGRAVLFVLVLLALLSSGIAVASTRKERIIGAASAAVLFVFATIAYECHGATVESSGFWLVGELITFVFFIVIGAIMLRDIFSGDVTGNRICGAICVYLLLGFSFAILQMAVLNLDPHALKFDPVLQQTMENAQVQGRPRVLSLLMYFSFCTLSTVGYGDITPVSTMSRTLAWLESIAGQLYLTILVARLVGQHIAASERRSPID